MKARVLSYIFYKYLRSNDYKIPCYVIFLTLTGVNISALHVKWQERKKECTDS